MGKNTSSSKKCAITIHCTQSVEKVSGEMEIIRVAAVSAVLAANYYISSVGLQSKKLIDFLLQR
jgi:hypothetical protein